MLKAVFLAIFFLTLMLNVTVSAEEYVPTISVSGEGVVEVPPDIATISVGVVSHNKDAEKVIRVTVYLTYTLPVKGNMVGACSKREPLICPCV